MAEFIGPWRFEGAGGFKIDERNGDPASLCVSCKLDLIYSERGGSKNFTCSTEISSQRGRASSSEKYICIYIYLFINLYLSME